ncbi:WG repeat-containing protein [Bacteroidales bacterium OttesenSCG-928-B11]|nr:WG repeat-containing protein [Bacteroidales bacterium OttesenSCG-928-C03]MDL2312384.1 WG repeat-containing protein [Bacteroidales bacterium OttesenSCG-928-B11]MDL2326640.1 WG repeat-containing protein [Bacteroidales bacterium OttesenSCG-928-A14]
MKYGFIDKTGELIIPLIYTESGPKELPYFHKGFCKINDIYIDSKGYEYFK